MAVFGKRESGGGGDVEMPFFEHLDQLRPRLVRSVAALALLTALCFAAKNLLMAILTGPQSPDFPTNRLFSSLADLLASDVLRINRHPLTLINTAMAGQFNLHISLAIHAALILAIPYMLLELWGFVKPALTDRELRAGRAAVWCITLCFLTGVLFGYFVLSPLSVNFLSGYTVGGQIVNMIDVGSYMSLILNLTFVSGLIFLLPVTAGTLARAGILSGRFMRRFRRHAMLVMAVLAAVITPPDAASMVLVMLPLCGLYELGVGIAAKYNP